jgi:hypothetical protein
MSALNDFTDEDRALIVSIPVRVGYWIAHIDDVQSSARDDRREQLALERALKLIVTKTDDARFINDVAEFALSSQVSWPQWSDNAGTVLADIPKALKLIEGMLTPKDLKDYKSAVYRVAGVVAQAAHEEGNAATKDGGILFRLADRLSVKTDMSEPENISITEKAALQKLMACLKG